MNTISSIYHKQRLSSSYLLIGVLTLYVWVAGACSAFAQGPFEKFTATLVSKICQGDTSWLRCFGEDTFSCNKVSTKIVNKCVTSEITLRLDSETTMADAYPLATNLNDCIKDEFNKTLGSKRRDSRECRNVHF